MAAALRSGASCPICRELFQDPVSIPCGHSFCRGCISRCWEWAPGGFACPRCRRAAPERSLRPNRQLRRVLEAAKRLSAEAARAEAEAPGGCPRHREPLRAFCREDAALLCAVCRESRAHRAHAVLPVREAAEEYKGHVQARVQALKEERDQLLALREAEMGRNWEYLEKTEAERHQILSEFEQLRLFLEEQARCLLAQLGRLDRDIEKTHEEKVTSLTEEISRLDTVIQEMEEKCRQPAREFLQVRRSWVEESGFQRPPLALPELEEKIGRFRDKTLALKETLRSFQGTLTLDPGTAHPQLAVSMGMGMGTPIPACWAATGSSRAGAAGTWRWHPTAPGPWGWPRGPRRAGTGAPASSSGPWGSARASSGRSRPWSARRSPASASLGASGSPWTTSRAGWPSSTPTRGPSSSLSRPPLSTGRASTPGSWCGARAPR
uniref:Zinc finger protein RFP-like n=1 Tax=Nothoprocta perdicaria TaxID=30464 RepID=A0A8C7EFH0_NOTPE